MRYGLVACFMAGLFAVSAPAEAACGDGIVEPGEQCDDQNLTPGDGCSDACATEPNWSCTQSNVVANGTFEAGDTGFTSSLARATAFAPSACNMPGTRVSSDNAYGVVQSPGQACRCHGWGGSCLEARGLGEVWRQVVTVVPGKTYQVGLVFVLEHGSGGIAVYAGNTLIAQRSDLRPYISSFTYLNARFTAPAGQTSVALSVRNLPSFGANNAVILDSISALSPSECRYVFCGDGKTDTGETCDDGNTTGGDGCSASCQVEPGWACDLGPELVVNGDFEATPPSFTSVLPEDPAPLSMVGVCPAAAGSSARDGYHLVTDSPYATCSCHGGAGRCLSVNGGGGAVWRQSVPVAPSSRYLVRLQYALKEENAPQLNPTLELVADGTTQVSTATRDTWPATWHPMTALIQTGPSQATALLELVNPNASSGGNDLALDSISVRRAVSACVPVPCGNGVVDPGEGCDDANTAQGDGCSLCQVEAGWSCVQSPSHCSPLCGNARLDTGEACDDGNRVDGDGCSAACTVEPYFTCVGMPSACSGPAGCGDGLRLAPEACDDGNAVSGDGCSAGCTVEQGYACSQRELVVNGDFSQGLSGFSAYVPPAAYPIPATLRYFTASGAFPVGASWWNATPAARTCYDAGKWGVAGQPASAAPSANDGQILVTSTPAYTCGCAGGSGYCLEVAGGGQPCTAGANGVTCGNTSIIWTQPLAVRPNTRYAVTARYAIKLNDPTFTWAHAHAQLAVAVDGVRVGGSDVSDISPWPSTFNDGRWSFSTGPGQSSVQLQLHNENPITTDGPRQGNDLVVDDISVLETACTLQCGNGQQDPGEGCDDGNAAAGDGCHQCAVEAGCWSCAGTPSVCAQVCDPDPGGATPDRSKSCAAVDGVSPAAALLTLLALRRRARAAKVADGFC